MITQIALKQLSAPQRTELIYSEARAQLSSRLWRAALGSSNGPNLDSSTTSGQAMGLDTLLAMCTEKLGTGSPDRQKSQNIEDPATSIHSASLPTVEENLGGVSAPTQLRVGALAANARHHADLESAAARTGIPATALAAIVNAEASKDRDGGWQCYSRNPRSSAAGLGQFLSGTWQGMAETKGSWLNTIAQNRGWLDNSGRVLSNARSALLSLRYDAGASINTIADYARQNLSGLKRAGVTIGEDAEDIARVAYLGHHLGLGDAIKFAKSGLDPARARVLLTAQIGGAKASQYIAQAGNASAAHRNWFTAFVNRNIQTDRFSA